MNKRPSDREPEADAVVQKSHEVASNIKHAALERVDTVKRSATALRDDTSDRVRELGATVKKIGEHFRVEDQEYIATKMTGASQHINKAADYVGSVELGTLVRDARTIARANPLVFLGSAFVLGLSAGRFLKGTSLLVSPAPKTPGRRRAAAAAKALSATADDYETDTDDLDDHTDVVLNRAQRRNKARAAGTAGTPGPARADR